MIKSLIFNEKLKILKNEDQVILINSSTGKWLKITNECYKLFKDASDDKQDFNVFINDFYDDDKDYILSLYEKIFELEVLGSSKPDEFSVSLALTQNCNLKCTHCCIDANHSNDIENNNTYEKIVKILEKLKDIKISTLILTGGEPMLRDDFTDILRYIHNNIDTNIILMTNGTLINEENINDILHYCHGIDISIDGIDEESCRKVRGEGVFRKVNETINLLRNKEFENISVSMTLTENNYKYRDEFIAKYEKKGVKPVVRKFSPIGRGKKEWDFYFNELKDSVNNINDREIIIDSKHKREEVLDNITACTCGGCCRELYITHDGNVYPCPLFYSEQFKLFNIIDINNLSDEINRSNLSKNKGFERFSNFMPDKYEKCNSCDVSLFCWTCIHYLDITSRDAKCFDDRCKKSKLNLQNLLWG